MDFSAKKNATIDGKGRVVLPADFKNQMGGRIPGGQLAVQMDPYEKCLNIYLVENWNGRLAEFKAKLSRNNRKQSRLLDMIYRSFKVVDVPESCRMNIPNDFLEVKEISQHVVFVGSGDMIRLWDAATYESTVGDMSAYSALYEELLGGDDNNEN